MNPPDPCPGPGRCHGCLKWCDRCGDVDQTCDVRERGDRCDEHPPLPSDEELLSAMQSATLKIVRGRELLAEGHRELEEVREQLRSRTALEHQSSVEREMREWRRSHF